MAEDVREDGMAAYLSSVSSLFSNDNMLALGIIISGFGALWGSLDPYRFLIFAAFLLLGLALSYLRYPKAWSTVVWLSGVYIISFMGMLFILGWASVSLWYLLMGVASLFLGLYVSFLLVQHVKSERDAHMNIEYVPLGIWGLVLFLFYIFTLVSAYGVYAWWAGGSLKTYIVGESFLILSIPYILGRAERIGVRFLSAGKLIYFGEDKCPFCEARLSAETKNCPECEAARIFQWCPICEGYSVVCPECRQKTLWRNACENCGFQMDRDAYCAYCEKDSPFSDWNSS